jgi:D-arabinose 1-dehydrogenase-like Zn-dependent alcohol dehydrogenase
MALNTGTAALAYIVISIVQLAMSASSPTQSTIDALNTLSTYITAISPLATFAAAIHDLSNFQTTNQTDISVIFGWGGVGKRLVFLLGHLMIMVIALAMTELKVSRIVKELFRRTSFIAQKEATLVRNFVQLNITFRMVILTLCGRWIIISSGPR